MSLKTNANLWRGKIGRHDVPEWGSDEGPAQYGAHVVRHDLLLLHAAVVLQGEDDRVIRSLTVKEKKELTGGGGGGGC